MLGNLRHASIPVYLPAWMPAYRQRIFHTGGPDRGGKAYFVSLSTRANTANASLVFWMTAQPGPGDNLGRRVKIGQGFTAFLDRHVGGNEGPTVFWRQGPTGYTMGGMAGVPQLLRAARSIVRVR
jgi:hypothetical protein